jgi:aspartokinase/homoserine dehydrogenase 1
MKVLKFGGSSLATPDRIARVGEIVARERREGGELALVVSALGGVTDELVELAQRAAAGRRAGERIAALRDRHEACLDTPVPAAEQVRLRAELDEHLSELDKLLRGVATLREASSRTLDAILSTGELCSSLVVTAALRAAEMPAVRVDSRRLVVTDRHFGSAQVHEEPTYRQLREHFARIDGIGVMTGFLGADAQGDTTTLGRGGSDYSASLLGVALGADAVELWTDVDGVMSADPRLVPEAVPIERISYDELMELSHFGAKVVHPPAVHPTRAHDIALRIKNTFRPEAPGTLVEDAVDREADRPVRGIASIGPVALLRLEGDGMVGVPGIAMRLFGALAREGVSVILISQASSEHSICFAVAPDGLSAAVESVGREFEAERRAGFINDLVVEQELAVVAAVGSGMRERPGIAGRLFAVLGNHGVNVRAIAQGSSELNISLVVNRQDESRAVHAIHDSFFLAGWKTVDLVVAGIGGVGQALLNQLGRRREELARNEKIRLRVVGVAGSQGALLEPDGLPPEQALQRLQSSDRLESLGRVLDYIRSDRRSLRVLVDCTASDDVPGHFSKLLSAGVSVVTANKRPVASSQARYDALRRARPGRVYYETTVGAGLPVIRTLQDLMATGDRILRIEGLLSGTLSYLMGSVAAGTPFSQSLRRAHEMGYTEPDPREDCGGVDVGRKLLILGREAGMTMEQSDVDVRPLLESRWNELELESFWSELPAVDEEFVRRQAAAAEKDRSLCYLATVEQGRAHVALEEVAADHPCARVRPGDNVIAVYSERYAEMPLIIRGPGAGPEVTAAGVFADILRAVAETGGSNP